ncbi:hypothetical protein K435DRAFT_808364 [Dendrothele bispora CBS 962.96]|uniref:Uncharacterized protein n=1 Tax=Dendrothele bispora (strain CBS 962.96) TaxID=1314807 RepID=A0A4V4HC96_DENBC|nr:hypothetical protein K435DRAFT_808364 [Dendrothele bispora CBS 962.96]
MSHIPTSVAKVDLGSIEIGVVLSSVLYGIILVQTYKYYQANFKRDNLILKSLACGIFMSVHSVLLWVYLYKKTVSDFTVQNASVAVDWTLRVAFPLTALITLLVQWYYPAVIIPALFIRLGLGVARGVVPGSSNLQDFVSKFRWLIVSASILGAAIDVCNTLALCILMEKNYNPLLRSRKLGGKMVAWIIETGLLTSVTEAILILSVGKCMTKISSNLANLFLNFRYCKTIFKLTIIIGVTSLMKWLNSSLNGRISLSSAQEAGHVLPGSLGPRAVSNDPVRVTPGFSLPLLTWALRTILKYTSKWVWNIKWNVQAIMVFLVLKW